MTPLLVDKSSALKASHFPFGLNIQKTFIKKSYFLKVRYINKRRIKALSNQPHTLNRSDVISSKAVTFDIFHFLTWSHLIWKCQSILFYCMTTHRENNTREMKMHWCVNERCSKQIRTVSNKSFSIISNLKSPDKRTSVNHSGYVKLCMISKKTQLTT